LNRAEKREQLTKKTTEAKKMPKEKWRRYD
jgi:hypothetical protein